MGVCASTPPVDPSSIPPEAVVWSATAGADDQQQSVNLGAGASTASLVAAAQVQTQPPRSAKGETPGGPDDRTSTSATTPSQSDKQHGGYNTVPSPEPSPAPAPTKPDDVDVEVKDPSPSFEAEVRVVAQDGRETPLGHVEVALTDTVLNVRQKVMYELDRVPERFLFIDRFDVPLESAAEFNTTLKDDMLDAKDAVVRIMKSPEPPVDGQRQEPPYDERSEDWDQELAQEEAELAELEALEAAEREEEERRRAAQDSPTRRKKKKSIEFEDRDYYEPDPPPPPPPEYHVTPRKTFQKPKILPVTVRERDESVSVLEHVLAGGWQSLESVANAGHFIRFHRVKNFYCQISPYTQRLEVEDATFRAVPGLNWTQNCVSFESLNHPGFFLKHTGADQPIKIEEEREGRQWRKDASWRVLEGLSGDPDSITLESVSKMGHAVTLKQFHLYLRKIERTAVFAKKSSFRCCVPLYSGDLPADEEKAPTEDPDTDTI